MNKILRVVAVLALMVITSFSACDDEPSAEEAFMDKLSGEWTPSQISLDNVVLEGAFDGFQLVIKVDKSFSTIKGNDPIWAPSGTFTLKTNTSASGFSLIRNDGVEIQVTDLSNETLGLKFQYTSTGGRRSSVSGNYQFDLIKNQ